MWQQIVFPQPILGREKLKNNAELALGHSFLILEVDGFSNSTSQFNVFILSSKLIEKYMGCHFCVFISANGIAKQSFHRGEKCIKNLLDTLGDWLLWYFNE